MRRIITIVCCCIVTIATQSATIGLKQAQQLAGKFMSTHMHMNDTSRLMQVSTSARCTRGVVASALPYYIFNSSHAFVIVAGDDRMPAILGYSDSNTFSPADAPPGLIDLLDCYSMAMSQQDNAKASITVTATINAIPIAPLLSCKWGQDTPFNLMCPLINDQIHATTGGVATAMAQIMYYYKWPSKIDKNIAAYYSPFLMCEMQELDSEYFPAWIDIKKYYHHDDLTREANAVARLMAFCGQAVNTNYSTASSASTAQVPTALTRYFKYAPTARYISQDYYSAEDWAQLLYNELKNSRPVIYRSQQYNGDAHAFVCDGYDGNGKFHINWGYNGQGDGYYVLTHLNPSDYGKGTNVEADGYIMSPGMVVGIEPEKDIPQDAMTQLAFYSLTVPHTQYSRSNKADSFDTVVITGRFNNPNTVTTDFDFGFGLFDNKDNLIKIVFSNTLVGLKPNYGAKKDWEVKIDATNTPGTYFIRPVSRLHGSGQGWQQCLGANVNYVKATIDDTTLNLTPMGSGGDASYEVTSVSINGPLQANRTLEVTAHVTNTGTTCLSYIHLLLDGSDHTVARCDMQPGNEGDVIMHCTPTLSGTHNITLAMDSEGINILYTTQVNITQGNPASLSVSNVDVAYSNSKYEINTDRFNISATLTNNGATNYEDYLEARIYRKTNSLQGSLFNVISQPVNIAAGDSTTVSFSFNNVMESEEYYVTLNCYSSGKLKKLTQTPYYKVMGDFPLGDVNCDHYVDVDDVNGIINVILGTQSADFYDGHTDVNNDGYTDVDDVNMIINIILGIQL